jgi:guanylate kinase
MFPPPAAGGGLPRCRLLLHTVTVAVMDPIEQAQPNPRPVVVVIGPSGSGKSRIVRELHSRRLVTVHPTWTTRPRRHDEAEGSLEHRFVSDAVFDDLDARGFFLDTVAPFGLRHRYGLPPVAASSRGPIDLVMLRAPLVARFARFVPNHVVYQIESSPDCMRERLMERGCDPLELAARLIDNDRELSLGRRIADRVIANDGPFSVVVEIVAAALRTDVPAHDPRAVA